MFNLCFFLGFYGRVAGRMQTIHEDDRMKFLLKAWAKKSQPEEEKADPLTQMEVVEGDASKSQRKRKLE
jgi:activator of HSP90 ATPase